MKRDTEDRIASMQTDDGRQLGGVTVAIDRWATWLEDHASTETLFAHHIEQAVKSGVPADEAALFVARDGRVLRRLVMDLLVNLRHERELRAIDRQLLAEARDAAIATGRCLAGDRFVKEVIEVQGAREGARWFRRRR